MDRSFFQKKIIFFATLASLITILTTTAFAEEKNKIEPLTTPPKIEEFTVIGTFEGILTSLDRQLRYLEVNSANFGPDIIFYIDQQTAFFKNKKLMTAKDFTLGDKIKVSYLRKDQTYLADIVSCEKKITIEKDKNQVNNKKHQQQEVKKSLTETPLK